MVLNNEAKCIRIYEGEFILLMRLGKVVVMLTYIRHEGFMVTKSENAGYFVVVSNEKYNF